jgi:hypothetical protein
MSGRIDDIGFTVPQRIAANLLACTFCNGSAEALLDAQADMLKGVGAAMGEWLQRRRDAIEDAQRLMVRMRESSDVTDIWKAQQEWASGALQRLAADVITYPVLLANAGQHAAEQPRQAQSKPPPVKPSPPEPAPRITEMPKPAGGRAARAATGESARAPSGEEMPAH